MVEMALETLQACLSCIAPDKRDIQDLVIQSIVSLTSSLVVKMLTVLVSIIFNSQLFLLKKCKSSSHFFFSKNNSLYAIFNGHSFNDTLTNDIISFEQLGPDKHFLISLGKHLLSR